MLEFLRKRRNKWQGINLVDMIPEKILAEETDPDTGNYILLLPRYEDFWFGKFLQSRLAEDKRNIKVPLEDRGTFLWDLIDGKTPILGFVEAFVEKFAEDADKAPERICAYMVQMKTNKYIRFVNEPR